MRRANEGEKKFTQELAKKDKSGTIVCEKQWSWEHTQNANKYKNEMWNSQEK